MTPNLFDTLQALLAQDPRFVAEDGTLLRNAVYEAAIRSQSQILADLGAKETQAMIDLSALLG